MADKPPAEPASASSDEWHKILTQGDPASRWLRRIFRFWPSSPRCGLCAAPFRGIGGIVLKPTGFSSRSRKNPTWCVRCFESAPMGGAEVPTGVLFADIRGFTSYSEKLAPEAVARQANRFYAAAANVFVMHDGVIDKLVGDEVMALWVPGFAGEKFVSKMVDAADDLLRAVGFGSEVEPWLPIGLGLDTGTAFVGNVGHGEVKDFTALGDVVNTAARLQSHAEPGQIVMSERVYEVVAGRYPDAPMSRLDLKGKSEPVAVRTIDLNATVPA